MTIETWQLLLGLGLLAAAGSILIWKFLMSFPAPESPSIALLLLLAFLSIPIRIWNGIRTSWIRNRIRASLGNLAASTTETSDDPIPLQASRLAQLKRDLRKLQDLPPSQRNLELVMKLKRSVADARKHIAALKAQSRA